MKRILFAIWGVSLLSIGIGGCMSSLFGRREASEEQAVGSVISLPAPVFESDTAVEKALRERRSIRAFSQDPLTLGEIAQLLWAAHGMTDQRGYRTVPSAGALYPLEIYLVAGQVEGLVAGIYRYLPEDHALVQISTGDHRESLSQAALDQIWMKDAPAVIAVAAIYERTTGKYSQRGIQYVHMEVGSVAQNVYLQAESLDLGTVFVGAFQDEQVQEILSLGEDEQPLALLPVGRKGE